MSVRLFPERINPRGKTHSECEQCPPMNKGPRLNEKEKRKKTAEHMHLSLCFMTKNLM